MRVSVFGLGYVGSVTAAALAGHGHRVVGVDINAEKVAMINVAKPPVVEAGLGELLRDVVQRQQLRATTSVEEAVTASELSLVCVGTPGHAGGRLDVSALQRVSEDIGRSLRQRPRPHIVVIRSTVLPGTTDQVVRPALLAAAGPAAAAQASLAVNPEFMREGSSLQDFAAPPLTLVGCDDDETAGALRTLYAGVDATFVRASVRTAEMVKYVANAFHALKICFANEVADACDALGADALEVMRIFLLDRKLNVSDAYLRPGFAFGGSCLPKDLRALLYGARGADLTLPVLSAILPSNEGQVRRAVEAVLRTQKRRIGVVGLSFKPGTDDLRESPMVSLVETLIGKGCEVRILDGNVALGRLVGANRRYIEQEIPHISALMCDDVETLLRHAQVLVIGNAGPEAARVLAAAEPVHTVIDLTRSRGRA
jgi:GDP-mannose 6-dehydrogenase